MVCTVGTVRQALADATPPARRLPERSAPATGPYVDLVRRWLIEDLTAPRKQRHTARRIWQRLVEWKTPLSVSRLCGIWWPDCGPRLALTAAR